VDEKLIWQGNGTAEGLAMDAKGIMAKHSSAIHSFANNPPAIPLPKSSPEK
jgi:hypothetical protein